MLNGLTKSQKQTIIWSANGNSLVQRGSKVELPTSGQLVLSYTNLQQVWAVDVAASGVNYVSMPNTGNFVLARQDYVNLWESFNSPTDTILSTHALNQDGILVSHVSETNYSIGNFQFLLQSVGDLVLSFDVTHNFVRSIGKVVQWVQAFSFFSTNLAMSTLWQEMDGSMELYWTLYQGTQFQQHISFREEL